MEDALDLLSRVVRAERASLARAARREGIGPEDAFDCVQDAFCTLLRLAQRGEVPAEAETGAYLAGIVRNKARNKRRLHHLARPHDSIDALEPSTDDSAESLVARAEEHVRLRAC